MARRQQIGVLIGSDHPVFHHVLKETCGVNADDPVAKLTKVQSKTEFPGHSMNIPENHFVRDFSDQ